MNLTRKFNLHTRTDCLGVRHNVTSNLPPHLRESLSQYGSRRKERGGDVQVVVATQVPTTRARACMPRALAAGAPADPMPTPGRRLANPNSRAKPCLRGRSTLFSATATAACLA